jgi:N-acyl-D-amino-acid deacylase
VKSARNQDAIGKSLVELGEMRGKDPLNAAFDLLQEEENAVGMVDFYGAEEHVVRIMNHPLQSVCSDGLMGPGKPHPRVYGAFPRVLGKYVREEKTLSLEAAIHKMTGRPAAVIGLPDRGLIAVGHAADVTVFDPAVVADKATYVDPVQFPVGIEHVMVNGQWAVVGGKETAARTGRVLRKGRN